MRMGVATYCFSLASYRNMFVFLRILSAASNISDAT